MTKNSTILKDFFYQYFKKKSLLIKDIFNYW